MNGKLEIFQRSSLELPSREDFIKQYLNLGVSAEDIGQQYDKILLDEIYVNNEYQVNIDKNPPNWTKDVIWHLSIKRRDKEPIHDWRDLQAIKNMLVGPEYEAVELYPAESRVVDTSNQYHLWVFVKSSEGEDKPKLPFGWYEEAKTNTSLKGGKQRSR